MSNSARRLRSTDSLHTGHLAIIECPGTLLLSNPKSLTKVLSSGESGAELNEEELAASLKSGMREYLEIDGRA